MVDEIVSEAQVVELKIKLPPSISAGDLGELVGNCGSPLGIARHGVVRVPV